MILVDSDVLIDFLLGQPESADFLKQHRGSVAVSAITAFEILEGSRNQQEFRRHQRFLKTFRMISINGPTVQKAFELFEKYFLNDTLRTADALIAATAIVNDLDFFSKNVRHFQNVIELRWKRPY